MGFWSINPYVGCEFGCTYCYARPTHRYLIERGVSGGQLESTALAADDAELFERNVFVKQKVGPVLRQTLRTARIGSGQIVIGTATDPYQPAEQTFGVTRAILEELARYSGLDVGIITKSPLIVRDITVLRELRRRSRKEVHHSAPIEARAHEGAWVQSSFLSKTSRISLSARAWNQGSKIFAISRRTR